MSRAYLGNAPLSKPDGFSSALRASVSRAVALVAGGLAFAVLVYLFELAWSVGLAGGN